LVYLLSRHTVFQKEHQQSFPIHYRQKHKPASVGLPLGVDAKIIDPQTQAKVKQGETGEVCIKGQQIIDHYEENRDPDSFRDGWFLTGDLGYFDKEGYLFLTGRKKEIIIRGGENINPREIEETLLTYPGIYEAAVVGQPDTILGEKVVAFLVADKKSNDELIANIKHFAKTKLSPQKVPADIYILDELPKGKTNKIDKNALKKIISSN
jgi:acyl-CoA synthetase (AMP-forming)/AMP-acid ligase II